MVTEADKIREVIAKAYINGVHIAPNWDVVRSGFHDAFRMIVSDGSTVSETSLEDFVAPRVRRFEEEASAYRRAVAHEVPLVDIAGSAATARIEIVRDGKHVYTDYMLLYKLGDSWKIVSKIYHSH